MINILAIESSCDETAASVSTDGKILSNVISSQKIHELYGGVVPELASRAHLQAIVPVVDQALKIANIELKEIDACIYPITGINRGIVGWSTIHKVSCPGF